MRKTNLEHFFKNEKNQKKNGNIFSNENKNRENVSAMKLEYGSKKNS